MNDKQREAIRKHGQQLLAIFPNAQEQEPLELCRRLLRLEKKAGAVALRLCNGPEYPGGEDAVDKITDGILAKVNGLLGNVPSPRLVKGRLRNAIPVFINRDPRGYALKIDDGWMKLNNAALHQDWGGYGILCPEIGKDGY